MPFTPTLTIPTLTLPLPSTPDAVYTSLWDKDKFSGPSAFVCEMAKSNEERMYPDYRCCLCDLGGYGSVLYCHIISNTETWENMRSLGYIPGDAKFVFEEPRNGIYLCLTHAEQFNAHFIYIRWAPETDEFFVVDHSGVENSATKDFYVNGNVLDIKTATTKDCPFPTAFLWHECRVRAFNPTCCDEPVILKRGYQRGGQYSYRYSEMCKNK